MNETNCSKFKKRAAALAVASCLSFAPWVAEAAGLGKLTVLSGLGQPLRAELELGANRDELAGMTARLAPQDAFRQAGIDFSSGLLDLRFAIEKRANGQAVVKVTSAKPVNEPFLDFLVELNWPAGRLVREYTFLLDPPEMATKRSVADAKVVETVQGGGVQADRPATVRVAPRAKVQADAPKTDSSGTRVVQPGETLRKIAVETQHDGVSLEQMLVGLLRKNPEAFAGNNINRLKSGAILGIPEKSEVEAVSPAEAKKVYVAQAADWNAYRQKLAATTAKAPAKEEVVGQSSSGKITARVEEKAAPAEQAKDQVKVSRTEMAAQGAAASKAAADAEADRIAKDKSLKEAQERLAMLEKNVNELQKLVEMKNQQLAELQQQTAAKKDEAKPVEAAKPVVAPPVAEPPKVAETVKPAEPPKSPEEVKPAVVDKPIEAPKLVEPPKPVQPASPPTPEPEPEASLLDDPLPLVGGGGILALLIGYLLFKRRRDRYASVETTAAPGPSSLGPNSVFRMTGGQSVDTGNTPPQTGDFSQTGPGTIDTDEVDPVAEADVYMAYGRDTQAEEILLEALQKDPQRLAIHGKLLEIYANRRSLKQFETLASELYAQTGGVGPEWEKVAVLGAGLDPENPLYSGASGRAPAPVFDPDATMIVSPGTMDKSTLAMSAGGALLAESAIAAEKSETVDEFERDTLILPEPTDIQAEPKEPVGAADDLDVMSLDFDLGSPAPEPEAVGEEPPVAADESYAETLVSADGGDALDFDLGGDTQAVPVISPSAVELTAPESLSGDFDLSVDESPLPEESLGDVHDFSLEGTLVMPSGLDREQESVASTYIGGEAVPEVPVAEPAQEDVAMVDFDLDMGSPATRTVVNPIAVASETEPEPEAAAPVEVPPEETTAVDSSHLENTVVNAGVLDTDSLEFDVNLTDSVFLGQPMINPEFDIGSINLDLGAEPPAAPSPAVEQGEEPTEEPTEELAVANEQPVRDSHWEEVNTKLDLAKAYEEMGDLEGARELLQEVVGEGSSDLVEQARAILGRIGE
ncbi:MAG: pilus assembly protein [Dechloromonas sp.]|nr:pilus assembly protein [Dechloromonas sp.]